MPSAIQFIEAFAKSLADRYPMAREQAKDSRNSRISAGFFSFADSTQRAASSMPRPRTIRETKTKVPLNTGGAAP